jgi:type III pantothenate kinase
MDINILVLNVGNSRLALATFVAGHLTHVARIPHDQRSAWPAAMKQAWQPLHEIAAGADPVATAVVGVCVNAPLLETIEHAAQQVTGRAVQWIGRQIDLPIPVLTENPDQTGVDRIVNVAAAFEQIGKPCVVVDAGSAVTVDGCNAKGEFIGGAIAPGLVMMLDALHARTARLPRVDLTATDVPAVGRSTESAIRSGVYHAIRGLVKEIVEAFAVELGAWPELIATGGDAKTLFDGWELVHAIVPDLTLYGAALAYAEHHIKHGM